MSYRVEWLPRAIEDLLSVPSVQEASRVDRALHLYAQSGVGFVRRVEGPDGAELRLYMPGYYAQISLDRTSSVVRVWRVFRFG